MDPKADVSCVDCLNGLFFCFGARQRGSWIRTRYSSDFACRPIPPVRPLLQGRAPGEWHAPDLGKIAVHARPSVSRALQDDCSSRFRDLRFCMRLKLADTENTKTLVRELIADRKSPTEGSVWQRRLGAAHVIREPTHGIGVTTPGGVGPVGPG